MKLRQQQKANTLICRLRCWQNMNRVQLMLNYQLTNLPTLHNLKKQVSQRLLALPDIVSVFQRADCNLSSSSSSLAVVCSHCIQSSELLDHVSLHMA